MASSSSSREHLPDKGGIDFTVSDDVPSVSHGRCKTQLPIKKFNIKPVDSFIPYPYTSYLAYVRDNYDGVVVEDNFQPKKKPKPGITTRVVQISTCTCSSSNGETYEVYLPLAKQALDYYNAKEHSNLLFVKVSAASSLCGPRRKVHINVIATSEDGVEKLLFAELAEGSVRCCLLQEIESGNPIGWGCSMCRKKVIHPGPRHGCLIIGGDLFEGYPFWGYRSLPRNCNSTPDDYDMYFACAMKAAEYFNSKQSTDFYAVEVMGSYTCPCHHKKVVHINFKCMTRIEPEPQFFFAELVVPHFTVDCGKWDIRKQPFVTVTGCCLLEKVGSGNPFGRDCELCYCSQLTHPGPKSGYRVRAGDDFKGYGFMNIGLGIF